MLRPARITSDAKDVRLQTSASGKYLQQWRRYNVYFENIEAFEGGHFKHFANRLLVLGLTYNYCSRGWRRIWSFRTVARWLSKDHLPESAINSIMKRHKAHICNNVFNCVCCWNAHKFVNNQKNLFRTQKLKKNWPNTPVSFKAYALKVTREPHREAHTHELVNNRRWAISKTAAASFTIWTLLIQTESKRQRNL